MSEGLKFGILHWGPCVVKTKADQATIDLLLSEGEASKEDASPELAGVLNNQFHYRDKNKFSKFMEKTFNLYNHAISQWKIWPKENVPSTYYLEKLWVNFQGPNEFNPPHDHSGDLTFVIYLKVPEKLKEENKKFKGKSSGPGGIAFLYGEGDRLAVTHQGLFPKEGHMVIFPAWVKHFVYPYKSNCTRVSVSGNIFMKRDEL